MTVLNHFILSAYLTSATTFLLGLSVLVIKRSWQRSHVVFAAYSFNIAFWSFCVTRFSPFFEDPGLLWGRLLHIGASLIPVLFLHFVHELLYLGDSKFSKFMLGSAYITTGVFVAFDLSGSLLITGVTHRSEYSYPTPGPLYPLFFAYFVSGILLGIGLLFKAFIRSSGVRLNQLKYLLLFSSIGYLGGMKHFLILIGLEPFPIYPYGTYAIPLYVLAVMYAITRYRLLDINVAITRATVFTAVYAALLGLPLFGALAWQSRLEQLFGTRWWVGLWLACAVLATIAHYVNLYFQRRAEERLLAEQRQYQRTLLTASAGMTQIRDLKKLLNVIVRVVVRQVRLVHGGIFLAEKETERYILRAERGGKDGLQVGMTLEKYDPLTRFLKQRRDTLVYEELKAMLGAESERFTEGGFYQDMRLALNRMEQLQASLAIPSFADERLLGFLVLGQKKSGQMYSTDDLSVFSTLANQAALAIENAIYFEELKTNQAYLVQSEKLASLGQLASGMAHEIHNPLAIISGESQLFLEKVKLTELEAQTEREKELAAKMRQTLESTIEECNRASDITRRILKFSRPGKEGFEPVDVGAIIKDSTTLVGYQVSIQDTEIIHNIPADLPKVSGNVNQLQEVFLNLVLNACQAMGGKGRLELSAQVRGPTVEVKVIDNGPGIPPEKLSKIFDPFYTTKQNGTGLGLFVTQRIMKAHGGSLAVESALGQGTTFTVKLPVMQEATAAT
ncbi:MAG: GAF domain-containing protein [Candidatus Omnitrophica bacterium]|nr:GAF domain-containing protein [Candidatus Omnitrophota bacterium]